MMIEKKGFTLIELLIVIGILGILAAAVVVVLNPAQLLAQARDGQRLSDLDSVKAAVALYLTDVASPILGEVENVTFGTDCGLGDGTCTTDADRTTDNAGWVGVNLNAITGGSPIPSLPIDPTNNANYNYAYDGVDAAKTFELNARLESEKHREKMKTDGGEDSACTTWTAADCYYEVGTDPGLNL